MINFPSDRNDKNNEHVGGSQDAADQLIARNMKKAAQSVQPRNLGPTPGHRRHAGRAGQPPVFQVIQQADGRLNTRRLKAASPLQTVVAPPRSRRVLSRRAGALVLVLALVALAFFAGVASARAQEIGEPWCEISAPALPATLPSTAPLRCIEPRVFVPIAFGVQFGGQHGDQPSRNHRGADDPLSVGTHGRAAPAISSNRAPAASAAGEDNGSGSRLR
jgi:hypothetical protein